MRATRPENAHFTGPRLLRWLCHRLELKGPARLLEGEDRIPDAADLEGQLAEHVRLGRDILEERAEIGMGIGDRGSMRSAVRKLFGDAAAPPEPKLWDPAEGPWGEAGFNRLFAKILAREGVAVEEAHRWRDAGVEEYEVSDVVGCPFEPTVEWLELGLHPADAGRLGSAGVPIAAGREFLEAGCATGQLAAFLLRGKGPSDFRAFVDAGIDSDLVGALVEHGIGPDEAPQWQALGGRLAEAGGRRDELSRWVRSGVPIDEVELWLALGVPPETAGTLREAGVTVAQSRPQWRRGRRRPETIIAAVQASTGGRTERA